MGKIVRMTLDKPKLNNNQPVFLGIDVHKNHYSLTVIHQGEVYFRCTIPAVFERLKLILEHYKGCAVFSVYEAGFSGFHLHRELTKSGVNNIVVAPAKVPVVIGDRVKTDRRDSFKLADNLSKGILKGIFIPTIEELERRQFVRTREQIKEKRVRVINQIKGILFQYGITIVAGMPDKAIECYRNADLSQNIKEALEYYYKELEFHEAQIKEIDKTIKKKIEENEQKNKEYNILKEQPGIGPVTAAALVVEVGDWNRFSSEKKISAYFGLTPSEYSSGEHIYKGRITGQGNPYLRGLLVETSWTAIRLDEKLKEFYNKIKLHTGSGKKAIVAVARKMLCNLYRLIKGLENKESLEPLAIT